MATIFVSYSQKNKNWIERLKPHLKLLERRLAEQGYQLEVWIDIGIRTGDEWQPNIFKAIDEAVVAVILVSADALTSDFILREELPRLLERADKQLLALIPLIVRPCNWQGESRLSQFQALPTGNQTLNDMEENEVENCLKKLTDDIEARLQRLQRLPLPSNPYKGLSNFEEDDQNVFFGRDEIRDKLFAGVCSSPLLCLVGSSGSGKSSLVYAGLVPRLRGAGWLIVPFRPRNRPLDELQQALEELLKSQPRAAAILPYNEADLADRLRRGNGFLVDFLRNVANAANQTRDVLLFVDQFEEVFTNCIQGMREEFLGVLLHPRRLEDPWAVEHLHLLWTIRFDFLEQAIHEREGGLSDVRGNPKLEILGDMNVKQLRDVIELPAQRSGAFFQRGLVETILGDVGVGNERGKLPLLEFCLEELWSEQKRLGGRVLSREAYEKIGGFQGAARQYADTVFEFCSAEQKAAAPTLFVQLVNVATGGEVGDTRRPVSREELLGGDYADRQQFQTLVDRLVDKRLLVRGEDPGRGGSVTIELAHEILIQAWERLKVWVDENREFLKKLRQVDTAMRNNQLLSGPLLDECETWLGDSRQRLLRKPIILFITESLDEYARAQIKSLLDGKVAALPQYFNQLKCRPALVKMLGDRLASESDQEIRRRLSLALLRMKEDAEDCLDYLKGQLLTVEPAEFGLVCDALEPYREQLRRELWSVALAPGHDPGRRLRAACALARFDPENAQWGELVPGVAKQLANENPLHVPFWLDALQAPVRDWLIAPLADLCKNRQLTEVERAVATTILADCAADRTDVLVDVLLEASAKPYGLLWPKIEAHRERATEILRAELAKGLLAVKRPDRDLLVRRQAQSAVALAQLGEIEPALQLLRHGAEPARRTYLVHGFGPLGAQAEVLIRALKSETDAAARRALILALGEFSREQLPDHSRESLLGLLLQQYRDDPDPGVHGAIDWLLRHASQGPSPRKLNWSQSEVLAKIDRELVNRPMDGRSWYVSEEGNTFTVISGPERFGMGSPEGEKDRRNDETPHLRRIRRRFAIATKPITVRQFRKFREENASADVRTWNYSPDEDCPQPRVSWFEAAAYCNWLSRREGILEDQWCYRPINHQYTEGMTVASNYLSLSGYRLPTEAEWEYSCRAGSSASRYFGDSDELLPLYAWFNKNAGDRTWPVGSLKPNDFGLFDMLGNVEEWCQDRFDRDWSAGSGEPIEDVEDPQDVEGGIRHDARVRRGGSFIIFAGLVRSADRDHDRPDDERNYVGFRPARTWA